MACLMWSWLKWEYRRIIEIDLCPKRSHTATRSTRKDLFHWSHSIHLSLRHLRLLWMRHCLPLKFQSSWRVSILADLRITRNITHAHLGLLFAWKKRSRGIRNWWHDETSALIQAPRISPRDSRSQRGCRTARILQVLATSFDTSLTCACQNRSKHIKTNGTPRTTKPN